MKWMYIDNAKVDRIVVNESEGKKPEQYVIRDINPNLQRLSATQITPNQTYGGGGTTGGGTAAYSQSYAGSGKGSDMSGFAGATGGRFYRTMNQYAIDAEHVVHVSMSDGLDNFFYINNRLVGFTCGLVHFQIVFKRGRKKTTTISVVQANRH